MNLTHGLSKHPLYKRWNSFTQRCVNPKAARYACYGGKGIRVEYIWHPSNPNGAKNFIAWLEVQLETHWPAMQAAGAKRYEIGRKNVREHFGPGNCELRFLGATTRDRTTKSMSFEDVVDLRQRAKAQTHLTLQELRGNRGFSLANISRALCGKQWKCVDAVEAPLPPRGQRPRTVVAA